MENRALFDLRWLPEQGLLVAHGWQFDFTDRLYVWDTKSEGLLGVFRKEAYGKLKLSPCGRLLLSQGAEGGLTYGWCLRDVDLRIPPSSWPVLLTWNGSHPCRSTAFFSEDSSLLVSGGLIAEPEEEPFPVAARIHCLDTTSLRDVVVHEQEGHFYGLAISPDGRWLAATVGDAKHWHDPSAGYELLLWELPGGTLRARGSYRSATGEAILDHGCGDVEFTEDNCAIEVTHREEIARWEINVGLARESSLNREQR